MAGIKPKVAVIGAGPGGIAMGIQLAQGQYVPAIAADVAQLTVFQRTPIWVSPRYDEPFTPEQQALFERDPDEALKVRDAAFQAYETANFAASSAMTKDLTDTAHAYLLRKVRDPVLAHDQVADRQQDHHRHGHHGQHLEEFGH